MKISGLDPVLLLLTTCQSAAQTIACTYGTARRPGPIHGRLERTGRRLNENSQHARHEKTTLNKKARWLATTGSQRTGLAVTKLQQQPHPRGQDHNRLAERPCHGAFPTLTARLQSEQAVQTPQLINWYFAGIEPVQNQRLPRAYPRCASRARSRRRSHQTRHRIQQRSGVGLLGRTQHRLR